MKRIHELDALRGFALFGILLVNMLIFHAPFAYYSFFYGKFTGIQETAVDVVVNYGSGKFMLIFAFIFGYGIALQLSSQNQLFNRYFSKRMLVLFCFGVLHILLFWMGDILASYAVVGLLVLPLIRLSNRTILILGIVFLLFPALYYLGVCLFGWPMMNPAKPAALNQFMDTFQKGSFSDVFFLRMKEFFAFIPQNFVWLLPKALGLFLIGIYAARKSLFAHIAKHKKDFLTIAILLICTSAVWYTIRMGIFESINLQQKPFWRPTLISFNLVFEAALGFGYIIVFTLLFQQFKGARRLFAKAGRMALTNYILQSLICVIIFYSYGFGLYGKLKPTDLILITVIIFSFNLVFSHIYFKYRTIGPLEYVWRKLIRK